MHFYDLEEKIKEEISSTDRKREGIEISVCACIRR